MCKCNNLCVSVIIPLLCKCNNAFLCKYNNSPHIGCVFYHVVWSMLFVTLTRYGVGGMLNNIGYVYQDFR